MKCFQYRLVRRPFLDIESIFKRAQSGDSIAHEELIHRLGERFRLFIHRSIWNKLDAEDILQDTLLIIEKNYRDLVIETSFVAWAHKVLSNQINQYYRKNRIHDGRFVRKEWDAGEHPSSDTVSNLERRLLDCLRKLHRINRRHARVINLHHQGFTTDEICRKFNVSRNSLYLLLFRARAMLKRCLDTGEVNP
jgi:RNA polymerase sigma factor (sigma-70 family)